MLHNGYRLATCHPRLAAFVATTALKVDFDLWVTEGYRSNARQDALYAQGRTADGSIVTNAQAGSSAHNFGLAIDVYPSESGQPVNPSDSSAEQIARFQKLGDMAADFGGVTWGGTFSSLQDRPHFEIEDWESHKDWAKLAIVCVALLGLGLAHANGMV